MLDRLRDEKKLSGRRIEKMLSAKGLSHSLPQNIKRRVSRADYSIFLDYMERWGAGPKRKKEADYLQKSICRIFNKAKLSSFTIYPDWRTNRDVPTCEYLVSQQYAYPNHLTAYKPVELCIGAGNGRYMQQRNLMGWQTIGIADRILHQMEDLLYGLTRPYFLKPAVYKDPLNSPQILERLKHAQSDSEKSQIINSTVHETDSEIFENSSEIRGFYAILISKILPELKSGKCFGISMEELNANPNELLRFILCHLDELFSGEEEEWYFSQKRENDTRVVLSRKQKSHIRLIKKNPETFVRRYLIDLSAVNIPEYYDINPYQGLILADFRELEKLFEIGPEKFDLVSDVRSLSHLDQESLDNVMQFLPRIGKRVVSDVWTGGRSYACGN